MKNKIMLVFIGLISVVHFSFSQFHPDEMRMGITVNFQSDSITRITISDSTSYVLEYDHEDQVPNTFHLEFYKDSLVKVDFSYYYIGYNVVPSKPNKMIFDGKLYLKNNDFKLSFNYIESHYNFPQTYLINGVVKDNKVVLTGFNTIGSASSQTVYLLDKNSKVIFKKKYLTLPFDKIVFPNR